MVGGWVRRGGEGWWAAHAQEVVDSEKTVYKYRGVRHWQEYRRTSELKYGIWNIFKSYFRICTCIFVYCSYHVI